MLAVNRQFLDEDRLCWARFECPEKKSLADLQESLEGWQRRPVEEAYKRQLAAADWPVMACKLADILDNLLDCDSITDEARRRHKVRARDYLDALSPALPDRLRPAFEMIRTIAESE